jgi:hypothetical protein
MKSCFPLMKRVLQLALGRDRLRNQAQLLLYPSRFHNSTPVLPSVTLHKRLEVHVCLKTGKEKKICQESST